MRPTRSRPSGPPAADVRPSGGGVGRSSSPGAERVSDDLRRGSGSFLENRRRIAALHSLAALGLGVVGLYQFGLLRRVPELPLPGLAADAVDASGEAYQELRTPDAALGIVSTGVTLVLAGMGDRGRAQGLPLVPLALAAKVALDAAAGGYLLAEQVTKHRRICSWCTVAALAQMAAVPFALPEARAAWKQLRS
jgi:hypothetical protein